MNTPQPQKATLKKAERIKSLKTIDELFKNGSSFFLSPFKVIYQTGPQDFTKAAFMVSKRNFKKATDRNRVKRLLRESWRLNRHSIENYETLKSLNIIWIYTAQKLLKQEEINIAVLKSIQKIIKAVNT
jgi:ribonuclease P protein component